MTDEDKRDIARLHALADKLEDLWGTVASVDKAQGVIVYRRNDIVRPQKGTSLGHEVEIKIEELRDQAAQIQHARRDT